MSNKRQARVEAAWTGFLQPLWQKTDLAAQTFKLQYLDTSFSWILA